MILSSVFSLPSALHAIYEHITYSRLHPIHSLTRLSINQADRWMKVALDILIG